MVNVFTTGNALVFSLDATEGGSLTAYSIYIEKVTLKATRKIDRLPVGGGAAVNKTVGPTSVTLSLEGWIHATVTGAFTTNQADTTPTTRTWEFGPQGSGTGSLKRTGECFITDYEEDTPATGPGKWTASLVVDGTTTFGSY